MPVASSQSDRLRSILVMLATAATIAFNALAAMGYVNGVTPKQVSDRYPTVLTPAGYAFTIWSLIYFGLVLFSIVQILPRNLERFRNVRTLYLITCVLNCGWIFFWHDDRPVICLLLIAMLAGSLLYIVALIQSIDSRVSKMTFGLYAGWVTVAAIVNLFVALVATGAAFAPLTMTILGVLAIVIGSALAVIVTLRLRNYLYSLAVAWAVTAIAINQSGNTAIVVTSAVGVIVTLLAALSFIIYLPTLKFPQRDNEQR